MKKIVDKQLGQLLIEKGIITQKQLSEALEVQSKQGGLVGQILVNLGYAADEEITQAITMQYGFPFLPLRGYEIDKEVLKLIPVHVVRQYGLIPVDKIGDTLTVAMANPLNIQAIEDIELLTKCSVQVFISTLTDLNETMEKYYGDGAGKKERTDSK